MFQHVLSSNAGTIQEFCTPFYRSIGGVKISIGFYEIQCKLIHKGTCRQCWIGHSFSYLSTGLKANKVMKQMAFPQVERILSK